jgi:hypothetical protein
VGVGMLLRTCRSSRRRQRRRWLPGAGRDGTRAAGPGSTARALVHATLVEHGGVMLVVEVVATVTVVGEHRTGEEDHRDDEYDPGDDRDPSRDPVEPIGLENRRFRWCCGGRSPPGVGFRNFTHASNDAASTASGRYVVAMKQL